MLRIPRPEYADGPLNLYESDTSVVYHKDAIGDELAESRSKATGKREARLTPSETD